MNSLPIASDSQIVRKNAENNSRTFGLWWLVANGFAWGVFYILAILSRWAEGMPFGNLMVKLFPLVRVDFAAGALIGALACGLVWGALVGALQGLVLRRRLGLKGPGWFFATWLGLLPLSIYLFLYYILELNIGFPGDSFSRLSQYFKIAGYASPFVLAVVQWLVLRRTSARSAWWLAAVLLTLGLVTLTMPAFAQLYRQRHALLLLTPGGIGLIYALTTWAALAFLRPRES